MVRLFLEGKATEARQLHRKFFALLQGYFHRTESGPGQNDPGLARDDVGGMPPAARGNERGKLRASAENARRIGIRRPMSAIRVLLVGADGRMGKAVAAAVAKDAGLTITAGLDRGDSIAPAIENCEVVIDFSTADATEAICRACAKYRKPLVLGTTGQTAAQKDYVNTAAHLIPLVFAANFGGNGFSLSTTRGGVVRQRFRSRRDQGKHHDKEGVSGTEKACGGNFEGRVEAMVRLRRSPSEVEATGASTHLLRAVGVATIPTACGSSTSTRSSSSPIRRTCRRFTSPRSKRWASTCALHDIRFVEDDWENPTVGAWGLGWEVWCDGMEVSQYTYFQQVGGLDVFPVAGRADLRAGAPGALCSGRRQRLRPGLQRSPEPRFQDLWRGLPGERARVLGLRTGGGRRRGPEAPVRGHGAGRPGILAKGAARGSPGPAGLRPRAEGLAPVQPDGRAAARSRWPSARATSAASATCARPAPWPGWPSSRRVPRRCPSSCSNCSPRRFPRACRRARRAISSAWRASAWPTPILTSKPCASSPAPGASPWSSMACRRLSSTAWRSARVPGSAPPMPPSKDSCVRPAWPARR